MGVVASSQILKRENAQHLAGELPGISNTEHDAALYELAGWTFGMTTNWGERKAVYQLRAEVYDRELRWSRSNDGYEVDIFDEFATHLVVRSPEGRVAATARTLDWDVPWMATECYEARFKGEAARLRHWDVHEVSRLCIAKSQRNVEVVPGVTVLDVFLKGILAFGVAREKAFSYFVTRAGMGRAMQKRGFDIPQVSPRHRMPDGCVIRSFLVANKESYEHFKLAGEGAI